MQSSGMMCMYNDIYDYSRDQFVYGSTLQCNVSKAEPTPNSSAAIFACWSPRCYEVD